MECEGGREVKKTVQLIGMLSLLIVLGIFLLHIDNRTVQLRINEKSELELSLKTSEGNQVLKPWFNKRDGLYYFFLPPFVSDNRIYSDKSNGEVVIVPKNVENKKSTLNTDSNANARSSEEEISYSKWKPFCWEQGKIYTLSYNEEKYDVVFMKSSNIPSLFIETESGTMEYLNADKDLIETGAITVVQSTKNVEYQGELKKISARGNSTFDNKDKKAYSFTLNNSYPLCGLDAGKKWNLLAMYFEYDKIHTKLVYDMADILGMEYGIDCTWVDLYCNGEYQGLYLLTEAVTVGEGRVEIYDLEKTGQENTNISGGYLIEKDVEPHLEEEGNGFVTEQCNYPFIVKNPEPATEEQMNYIQGFVQNIEDLLVVGDERYKEYIDIDSFAKQFLIDKIALEPDAMNMSTFFYKEMDSDILKAGPLWDYDRAFGGALSNYSLSVGDYPNPMHEWYMEMYEDEEYKEKLISYYEELLPFFDEMLNGGIDEYAKYIHDSVKMDAVKWPNEYYQTDMMNYLEYDSHVQYLKYFLANRLNYLNEVWEITDWHFQLPESNGEKHLVQFVMDDGTLVETREITDGDSISNCPALDSEKYSGWEINKGGKIYDSYIPVYEDVILNAKRDFYDLDERMTYKIERLHAANDLSAYLKAVSDQDFSVFIYMDGNSELLKEERILTGIKEVCNYKHPDWMDKELEAGEEYFLVLDNGWRKVWDSASENMEELSTTFGMLNCGMDDEEEPYLYIQGGETNYLAEETRGEITIIVINRYTGEIVDTSNFH